MPRRAASGQSCSRHAWKFAAAWRIASALILGSPDAPDRPLHTGSFCFAIGRAPVGPTKEEGCCAGAAPDSAAARTAAVAHAVFLPMTPTVPGRDVILSAIYG